MQLHRQVQRMLGQRRSTLRSVEMLAANLMLLPCMAVREGDAGVVGACAVLPLITASVFLSYSARDTLREQAGAVLALVNQETFRRVEEFLARARADVDAWSGLLVMQDVLIGDAQGDLALELESLRRHYPQITALAALNAST